MSFKFFKYRFLLVLLLITSEFSSNIVHAQREKFPAKIKFEGSDEVIEAKVLVWLKDNDKITYSSLDKKIKIIIDGKKEKVREDTLTYIEFIDNFNKKRIFRSEKSAGFVNPRENLVEELYKDKISLYLDVDKDAFMTDVGVATGAALVGGITVAAMGGGVFFIPDIDPDDYVYIWIKKENEEQKVVSITQRDSLISAMSDRPDLHARIKSFKDLDMLLTIVKDYARGYEATQERLKKQYWNTLYGRLKRLEEQEHKDTISASKINFETGDYGIYTSNSGEMIFCQIKEVVGSKFATIQYEQIVGHRKEYTVLTKDILIIQNPQIE